MASGGFVANSLFPVFTTDRVHVIIIPKKNPDMETTMNVNLLRFSESYELCEEHCVTTLKTPA